MTDDLFKHITADKLMKRFDWEADELEQACNGSLQAYSLKREPIINHDLFDTGFYGVSGYGNTIGHKHVIGYNKIDHPVTLEGLKEAVFLIKDIDAFEKDFPEIVSGNRGQHGAPLPQQIRKAEFANIERKLDTFLLRIDGDIEIFYKSLLFVMKNKGGMFNTSLTYAREAFRLVQNDIICMQIEDLDHKFYGSEKYTRDIQGAIAQKMIERLQAALAIKSDTAKNIQLLYKRLQILRKSPIKAL